MKKASEMLRDAARMLYDAKRPDFMGCCAALGYQDTPDQRYYYEVSADYLWEMAPLEANGELYAMYGYWFGDPKVTPNKNQRTLCLLLAAEYAEAEGY